MTEASVPFPDRRSAGRLLAGRLSLLIPERCVVLALPRGGVPVAVEIGARLAAPVDVLVTRKIGYPPQPELGVGAIAEGGEPVFDARMLAALGLRTEVLAGEVERERAEVARRVRVYRGDRPLPEIAGLTVVVADDGLATGVTARAALRALRAAGAGRTVLAVPVAPEASVTAINAETDEVVTLVTPRRFRSVGECYASFGQLSDSDVLALLAPWRLRRVGAAHPAPTLSRALVLVKAAPCAVFLGAGNRVVQAVQADRAASANGLGLAFPDFSLRLALAVRAEEDHKILATTRGSILPPPVRAGEHSRLPAYLGHGSVTSKSCLVWSVRSWVTLASRLTST